MSDRLKAAIMAALDAMIGPRLDRCALYPARVVRRLGDDPPMLEVQLDDGRWPTLTRVPLRPPLPGMRVAPVLGSRVIVGWEEADPAKPYALPVWGPSEPPEYIHVRVESGFSVGDGLSEATKARSLAQHLSAISKDLEVIAGAAGVTAANYGTDGKALLDAIDPIAATKVFIE